MLAVPARSGTRPGMRPPRSGVVRARQRWRSVVVLWLRFDVWMGKLVARDAGALSDRPLPATLAAAPGDDVLATLYADCAPALLAYCRSRLPEPEAARDVLADVFLAAVETLAAGRPVKPSWLFVVARRRVADYYRDPARRIAQSVEGADTLASGIAADPLHVALTHEALLTLRAQVARLPEDQRDVVLLRFAGGLRTAEIAELIGKSDEATRAMLSRALRRLRREWPDDER